MEGNKKDSNSGCLLIGIICFMIANIVYFFYDTSSKEIASMGETILFIVGIGVAFFIIKLFFPSNDSKNSGASKSYYIYYNGTDSYYNDTDSNKNFSNSNDKKDGLSNLKGCLLFIGAFLFIGIIASLFSSSYEANYTIGVLFVLILAVVIGVLLYNTLKDL